MLEQGRRILRKFRSSIDFTASRAMATIGFVCSVTATLAAEDYLVNVKPVVEEVSRLADEYVCRPLPRESRMWHDHNIRVSRVKEARMRSLSVLDDDNQCLSQRRAYMNFELDSRLSFGSRREPLDVAAMGASYTGVLVFLIGSAALKGR